MATPDPKSLAERDLSQYLPMRTLRVARDLAPRFQESPLLNRYVAKRLPWLIGLGLLVLVISVACAAAVTLILLGATAWLALPAFVLAPFVLAGSGFVLLYLLASWLEGRALRASGVHSPPLPPIPWVLAGAVLFAPLAVLLLVAWHAAALLVLLSAAALGAYSALDR